MSERWLIGAPRAAWSSRRHLGYALDVLRHTACATCSLGSDGLRDAVRPGLHLCRRRLDDLERVVAPPMEAGALAKADLLDRRALQRLGRLTEPHLRRSGGAFEAVRWEDALHLLQRRLTPGAWSLHVGPEELSDEDADALAALADRGAAAVTRVGSVRGPWRRALAGAIGAPRSPTTLNAVRAARRVVLWGPVDRSHPELVRWLSRRAEVLCVGTRLPGHRTLDGDPVELAWRGCAAAWKGRPDGVGGEAPRSVPEPALTEPALHIVDAALEPGAFVRLAQLQGVWARGGGLLVLGGQPGVAERLTEQAGDAADVVVTVGDARVGGDANFRAHLGWFADPTMLLEPRGEVLVLPLRWRFEAEGGSHTTAADGSRRFSPQVLGHPMGEARCLSRISGVTRVEG